MNIILKGILKWFKNWLDRLQTTNPKFFRVIMVLCALFTFFILADQWFDFVDLGKIELQYDYINYIMWILFGFSWLPNEDNPKKLSNLLKKKIKK